MSAKYWIAQHIEDLFRNEPKNIGVFVQAKDVVAAKFLGEVNSKEIDGRKIKSIAYPDVYKQWIQYWRKLVSKNSTTELLKTSGSHYRVMEGGEVTDIDSDNSDQIVEFLYSMLVSEGGYNEAFQDAVEGEPVTISFENEIVQELNFSDLLNSQIKHPIVRNRTVEGDKIIHRPSFVQENGSLYVMEMVDFTTYYKSRPRDHAGYSAYMFNDIKSKRENAEPIAIVKVRDEDHAVEEVRNGLIMLQNESKIVNWNNIPERTAFLEERKAVAF